MLEHPILHTFHDFVRYSKAFSNAPSTSLVMAMIPMSRWSCAFRFSVWFFSSLIWAFLAWISLQSSKIGSLPRRFFESGLSAQFLALLLRFNSIFAVMKLDANGEDDEIAKLRSFQFQNKKLNRENAGNSNVAIWLAEIKKITIKHSVFQFFKNLKKRKKRNLTHFSTQLSKIWKLKIHSFTLWSLCQKIRQI